MEVSFLKLEDMLNKLGLSKDSMNLSSLGAFLFERSSLFEANTNYGIALISEDEAGNKSPVSNIVQVPGK